MRLFRWPLIQYDWSLHKGTSVHRNKHIQREDNVKEEGRRHPGEWSDVYISQRMPRTVSKYQKLEKAREDSSL